MLIKHLNNRMAVAIMTCAVLLCASSLTGTAAMFAEEAGQHDWYTYMHA